MARYAVFEVILILLLGTALSWLAFVTVPWLAAIPMLLSAFFLWFFRDPPRSIPQEPGVLVSPADGKIVTIDEDATMEDGSRALRIMIFLSVFNVHLNRSPCLGRVTDIIYREGKFLNALDDASSTDNEDNTIVLEPDEDYPGPIRVRQIVGVLARRIVCATQVGARLARGEQYGMIKFGSRTELVVPFDSHWLVCVKVGDRVRGGATTILKWDPKKGQKY